MFISHPFVIVVSQFALFAIQLAPVHALYAVPAHVFVPPVVNAGCVFDAYVLFVYVQDCVFAIHAVLSLCAKAVHRYVHAYVKAEPVHDAVAFAGAEHDVVDIDCVPLFVADPQVVRLDRFVSQPSVL